MRAPSASGPGTAMRGRDRLLPGPGLSLVPGTAAARPHRPRTRHRSGLGTGERGGNQTPPGLSPAGPDPPGGAAGAPPHSMAGTGLFLRVHGRAGRDPAGVNYCETGLCRRELPAGTRARL